MMIHAPRNEAEVEQVVARASASRTPLSIVGGGTRAGFGRPAQTAETISLAGLSGITLYEPGEMVIAALAGTPLAEVEAALDARGQMLTFEPMDHRLLLGTTGEPTIGAIAAMNVSGPRRIFGGAARDSLIGVRFVNGRGETVRSGGRVMKNVTGLDLVKLLAGAHGTLGVLTEVTFKVLPKPAAVTSLLFSGLDDHRAIDLLAAALGSPFEITGAAHLPAGIGAATARTLVRLEGFPKSLDYRTAELARLLGAFCMPERLDDAASADLWRVTRDVAPLAEPREAAVWRLSLVPGKAPAAVAAIAALRPIRHVYDWGGGLVWLATAADGDAGAETIRVAARDAGGHATLVRGAEALRAAVPVFQPPAPAAMALAAGIKKSFDPAGILNPGRMYAGV